MDSSSSATPPEVVLRHAAGRAVDLAWRNELGGTVWRIDFGTEYLKWTPSGLPGDLSDEADRLRWAGQYTTVPTVLDVGSDTDGQWMLTEGISADSAISGLWPIDHVVRSLGIGLRLLHDRLPVAACPWTWSTAARQGTDAARALGSAPDVDRLVVCHGDNCAPNTLLDSAGDFVAHVDLDQLGVADRWADIGTALWSLEHNFGPGWEAEWFDAYGVERDPVRERFYRSLWQLG